MSKKTFLTVFGLILITGTLVRFYKLGNQNIGFFRDEAALGFSSWSILKTGADEYGQRFPVIFRSFEVFFMPLYVYLSVPIFYIFGLTIFSARAISAISGVLLIVVSYFLGKEFFNSKKIGLILAFVTSISPWAIFYSRGAFEGNLALLLFSTGVYFWLVFKRVKESRFIYLSAFAFVLSMYSYQAPRFVAPLFLGVSILVQRKWWVKWKLWLAVATFAAAFYLPVLFLTTSAAGYHRAVGVSIFSKESTPVGYNANLGKWQNLYLVPKEVLSLYSSYFSFNNLFFQADYNPQRRVPGKSVFYLWQMPFLILGAYFIIKSKKIRYKKELFVWILLAPIPGALTRDPFHTYRTILFFVPLSLLVAFGFYSLLERKNLTRKLTILISLLIIPWSFFSFSFRLLKVAPIVNWHDWDFGYVELGQFLKKEEDARIVIDDRYTESYIHFLYSELIPLSLYQKVALENSKDGYYSSTQILRPEKVGRFEFREVDWPSERGDPNTIFVFPANRLYPSEFSGDPKLDHIKTIFAPSGDPAFYVIKTKKN